MRRSWIVLSAAGLAAIVIGWLSLGTRDTAARVVAAPAHVPTSRDRAEPTRSVARPTGGGSHAPLFSYVEPADAARLNALLPAPARVIHYVRIDRAAVEAKSSPFWQTNGTVELPLADGQMLRVVIDHSEMLGADRFTSTGHLEGEPATRAVFAYNQGFLSASVDTERDSYALRPADDSVSQFYQVDPALLPPCGGVRHPQVDAALLAAATARRARAADAAGTSTDTATTGAAEAPQHPEVHVMMLYTQAVKPTLTGSARAAALQSEFDQAIAKVNNELAASLVAARVKLVKVAETQYAPDNPSTSAGTNLQDTALTALYKTDDGQMDEIHALRDQSGADVVCLALNRSDPLSIGLSFVLDTPAAVDASAGVTNPLFAFAVVQYAMIAATDVVPHELGHVFGCAHARGDPGATGTKDGAYTYSYGYRFRGSDMNYYHDIMAYQPGTGLRYYSNPYVTVGSPANAAIGILPGQPGESDCALTIDEDAFEVSSYRLQTQAAPAGALVNVSTRAYVGNGDSALIGGFVVDGTQSKRVLIRAAGPALAAYGVAAPLAHPVLEVHAGSTVVARNAGWGNQDNPGNIATVAAQVGAFPFNAASADSALITTLPPGAYTAVVQPGDGAPGSALVEVYDVDQLGNKIVNLSTRGYADKGREMIGGFSVQGLPGTTKRMLIRVLGPTLARSYAVTGAMDDPMMELHNAAGDLLLKNDDWSSGDTGGAASATNDFTPWVRTYSEQQIAATGLAPTNRREPCVMVDLAPGNYSVIAQPFESLTSTPPEPAQPGVALVEVYEIAK